MFRTAAPLLVAAILCVSCNEATIEQSRSLVGGSGVPSAVTQSRETLYIFRGTNDWGGDNLSYELRPNGSLTVTHTYSDDRNPQSVVRGKETVRVSPAVAAQVRKLLWRVRPARLEGQGMGKSEVRPVGCERRDPHDFGEVGVGFITKQGTKGLFELPTPGSCNTPAATEARKVVWQALRLLPQSKVTASFERTL